MVVVGLIQLIQARQLPLSMQLIHMHVSALALTSRNKEHFITKLRKWGVPPSVGSYVRVSEMASEEIKSRVHHRRTFRQHDC
jgi:hypothetical protein